MRDIERPLAKRGRKAAPRMGKALREKGVVPDYILCSPAVRARQTMERFVEAAELNVETQFEQNIYEASSAELLKIVRHLPDERSCVLMVGHNPGFENLLSRLIESVTAMPTAALACIEFQINKWEDVEDGQGELHWYLTPKLLKTLD
jgi:phosphohistidine phosphatase